MDLTRSEPYWWDSVNPVQRGSSPPASVDTVIVGAGFTGLSAALQLARSGRSVIVFDSRRAGAGASTRNGGMCTDQLKPGVDDLVQKYGEPRAASMLREARAALNFLSDFIRKENIDCQVARTGRYRGAFTTAQRDATAREYEKLAQYIPMEFDVVPKERSRDQVGTDAYMGGVLLPHLFVLHPGLYHKGLLDRAVAAGAMVMDETPVLAVEKDTVGFNVHSASGKLHAKDVIIATNGYSGPLQHFVRSRVIPVLSSMIATEPLESGTMESIFPADRGVIDTNRLLVYYRRSPDGKRILFGGRPNYSNRDTQQSGATLARYMRVLFPELSKTKISHSWNGYIAYSFDKLPHISQVNGIHYAVGCCGAGIAMMTWLGRKLAMRVLQSEEGASAFGEIHHPGFLLYRGNAWFLPLVQLWYRTADMLAR